MDENRLEQMPHTIGRYQIQESIGYGAMGAVYKAFDPLIKRTLAIKTIRLDIPRQSPQYKSFIERFYHEARISGTLSHPNIVTLFDIGEEGGIPYLAMEFVEGDTISGILERGQRFNPERVISLVSQIASAVDYAHSKGVIHRDIKPSNLILYEGERVKVTDFGIAKLVDAEMTQSGTLLGTPSYMSPEQAMGDKLDGRSDIFSLGVCAFEMLSGEQPFPGNNVTSILYKLVHVDPIQPANLEMNGLVPQKWHEVFGRVLAKRPDDRYQTATDFVQDLEYCLGAWFGSNMGEEAEATMIGNGPGATDVTAVPGGATAAPPPEPPPAAPPPPVSAAPAPPPSAPPPAASSTGSRPAVAPMPEDDEQLPPTVNMKPDEHQDPAAGGEKELSTVLMSAPVALSAAAPPAPATPPPAPASATEEEPSTILMKAGQTPAAPAPPAPAAPAIPAHEKTVLMTAASLGTAPARKDSPPPRKEPAPAAPSAPSPAAESTVLMGAVGAKPAPEVTVKAPVPPPTVKQPVLPAKSAPAPPATPPSPPTPALPRPPAKPAPISAPAHAPAPTPAPVPAMDESAPTKGAPLGLILGAVGLVLFLAAVFGGILLYRKFASSVTPLPSPSVTPTTLARTIPTTPTPPPPVPATGTLHVESTPQGATVSVDGESRGVTPLDLSVALGSHEVKVEMKGFASSVQTVEITAQAPGNLTLALTRAVAATGMAEILSNPPGATVSIDGSPAGPTPITDLRLKAGSHRVDVSREGYESWSGTVNVQAGKRARVDAALRPIPKATPTPAPDSVDPNKIYVNAASDVDVLAKKVSGNSVAYPRDRAPRLKSGESVSVSVSFIVTENGEVTDLKVTESGGKVLDEEVMNAIRTWKFSPALKKGVKVKVRAAAKQTFRAG